MRTALTFATAALLSTVALAQANPAYTPPPSAGAPYEMGNARGGDPGMVRPGNAPEQKAAHRARRKAKLASMSPAQREAWKQKKKSRRAARQEGAMQRPGA